jgi:hypothetical protein
MPAVAGRPAYSKGVLRTGRQGIKLLRLLLLIAAKAVLLILHSFAENVKLYL